MMASAQPGTCSRSKTEGFAKAALAKHEVRVTVFFEEAGGGGASRYCIVWAEEGEVRLDQRRSQPGYTITSPVQARAGCRSGRG
jgi:hypothetical protein